MDEEQIKEKIDSLRVITHVFNEEKGPEAAVDLKDIIDLLPMKLYTLKYGAPKKVKGMDVDSFQYNGSGPMSDKFLLSVHRCLYFILAKSRTRGKENTLKRDYLISKLDKSLDLGNEFETVARWYRCQPDFTSKEEVEHKPYKTEFYLKLVDWMEGLRDGTRKKDDVVEVQDSPQYPPGVGNDPQDPPGAENGPANVSLSDLKAFHANYMSLVKEFASDTSNKDDIVAVAAKISNIDLQLAKDCFKIMPLGPERKAEDNKKPPTYEERISQMCALKQYDDDEYYVSIYEEVDDAKSLSPKDQDKFTFEELKIGLESNDPKIHMCHEKFWLSATRNLIKAKMLELLPDSEGNRRLAPSKQAMLVFKYDKTVLGANYKGIASSCGPLPTGVGFEFRILKGVFKSIFNLEIKHFGRT